MMTSTRAFSLIEIILVVTVVGLIIIVLSNVPSSLGLIGNSGSESAAKEIAIQSIENTRSKGFDNLADGITQINDSRLNTIPSGSGQITIAPCPVCSNGEDIKKVSVTVTWKQSGKDKNISFDTLVAKGGLH